MSTTAGHSPATAYATPSGGDTTVATTARRRGQQLLPLVGLGYPVLTVLGFAAFPKPPGGDVSAAHDPLWLARNTGAVIGQSYVRALAAVGFVVLAVALAGVVGRTSTTAARLTLVGGSGCGLLLLATQATTLGAALSSRSEVDATAIRVLDGLQAGLLDLSSLPAVLLFAAAAVALLSGRTVRGGTLPRWFAVATLVGAPLSLLDAGSYDGGPLAFLGLLGLVFFLAWSVAASVVLVRDRYSATG